MTIGSQPLSLLDSAIQADSTRAEISMAVLKKAQDVAKEQGAAIVDLLENAAATPAAPSLDVYA